MATVESGLVVGPTAAGTVGTGMTGAGAVAGVVTTVEFTEASDT